MRPGILTALAAVVLGGAAPVALAAQPTTLGTGAKTCVLNPGTSCKAVAHHRASLAGRDLHGARFHGARMRHADFRGANLRGAHFHRAVMHHADFSGADLRGARFHGTKLRGADFGGAKLKGAHFGPPTARKGSHQAQPAPSCNPNCAGADLTSANFSEANLTGANFTSANLTSANLTRANLTGANLTGANLTSANLTNANFTSANLTNANFASANRTGTTFTNATGTAQFKTIGGTFLAVASLTGTYVANWSFSASWQTPIAGVSFGGYGTANCPGSYGDPSAAPGYICLYPNTTDLYYAVSAQTLETYRECTVTSFGFACVENWYGSGAPSLSLTLNAGCSQYCHHAFPNFRGSWAVTPLTS
jgi:uncharacterized protein YjbI with pentapeptide repeats